MERTLPAFDLDGGHAVPARSGLARTRNGLVAGVLTNVPVCSSRHARYMAPRGRNLAPCLNSPRGAVVKHGIEPWIRDPRHNAFIKPAVADRRIACNRNRPVCLDSSAVSDDHNFGP